MIEVNLGAHPEVEGKTLDELAIHKHRSGVVMSVRSLNGEHQFNPPSDKTLSIEDALLLLVPSDYDRNAPLI
jgi:Trk K+ transport system NAD-binding subunit